MKILLPLAEKIAAGLISRKQTIAVAESSTGGLVAAALLAVPGASGYFLGGAVVYTRSSRAALLGIGDAEMQGLRPATEGYTARARAPWCDVGLGRNRGGRSDRQPLRRSGGAHLHSRGRLDRTHDHAAHGRCRPRGEHGCFCKAVARTSCRSDRCLKRTTRPLPPFQSARSRGTHRSG
jgi:Competence-damaged protein